MKSKNQSNSSLPDADAQQKAAAKRFNEFRDRPRPKKSPIQRLAGNLAARIALGTVVVGTAGYEAYQHDMIPGIHRTVDNAKPFDVGKLDTERQTVIFGKNAQYATPDQITNLITSPFPQRKPDNEIKTPADLPQIAFLISLDLQGAGKVEIFRGGPVAQAGPLIGQTVPSFLEMVIENQNTPLGLVIPEGINADSAEIFLAKPRPGNMALFEKFNLGDGKSVITEVRGDFLPTDDLLKLNPTIIDVDHPKGLNYLQDIFNGQGKPLSITDKVPLFSTRAPNSTITISTETNANGNGDSAFPIPYPKTQNGSMLFSPLNPATGLVK